MRGRKYIINLLLVIFIISGLNSCRITKRVHSKGWYVQKSTVAVNHPKQNKKEIKQQDKLDATKEKEAKDVLDHTHDSIASLKAFVEENPIIVAPTVKKEKHIMLKRLTKPAKLKVLKRVIGLKIADEEPPAKKGVKVGQIMMYTGLALYLLSGVLQVPILNFLGFSLFIAGLVFYLIARKKKLEANPDYEKSDKSRSMVWKGLMILTIGIALAIIASYIIKASEAAAGASAAALLGGVFGMIMGFVLGVSAAIMITVGIIKFIKGLIEP